MPKTVPWKDKEQWFKRYESGESVAKLSGESGKDPRTVQRGIEDVGDWRATQKVREVLFREAHRFHQKELLGSVELGSQSVASPPRHPDLGFQAAESSRFHDLGPVRAHRKGGVFDVVTIGVENEFSWELLNKHLGRDEMFRQLDVWKRSFLAAMNAHMALRTGVVTALEDLGYQLSDDLSEPGRLRPGGAKVLLRAGVSRILTENPPYGLRVYEGENGEFFIEGDTDLAAAYKRYCGKSMDDAHTSLADVSDLPAENRSKCNVRLGLDAWRRDAKEETYTGAGQSKTRDI